MLVAMQQKDTANTQLQNWRSILPFNLQATLSSLGQSLSIWYQDFD